MVGKRDKSEEIVSKLRQVEVLQGQRMPSAQAVRQIGVPEQTYYRWRKQYGGMTRDQLLRLKELEVENQRLRRPVRYQPAAEFLGNPHQNVATEPSHAPPFGSTMMAQF